MEAKVSQNKIPFGIIFTNKIPEIFKWHDFSTNLQTLPSIQPVVEKKNTGWPNVISQNHKSFIKPSIIYTIKIIKVKKKLIFVVSSRITQVSRF